MSGPGIEGPQGHRHEGPELAVIVRTMADANRADALLRALDTIDNLQSVAAYPIIVVNGRRYDPDLVDRLRRRDGSVFHYMSRASAGAAVVQGRRLVESEFFMYLDDDDELLADGIGPVLVEQAASLDWDLLVLNGERRSASGGKPWVEQWAAHTADPLRSLVEENWLSPGNTVFRAATVNSDVLDVDRDHHEWTYIAYRLMLEGYKVSFHDKSVTRYNDTEDSLSKRDTHDPGETRLLEDLRREARLPRDLRAALEAKYRNHLHVMAERNRFQGRFASAWRYHLRSLKPPFTLRYLPYTRKLLRF
ncbi:hypothetical protein SAOR_07460 [Salinisphaera orenii MK-B5]|uniref:Glycosyltransferase 2-like domain-containing protein n=1 Tax=Salinisphaera orenii MK-B5 TaxID=856730 RepID=A0A423PQG3_9GAMM|nr:hypothetical protein [Salinisphaera orenii]ROO27845.1 hypothetical protein SAOR_07460 [Salinisphaera orenii MK-B5]